MTFLGYRIGRNYRPGTGAAYTGTRPSPSSVRSICRRVSELTTPRDGLLPPGVVVARLNRLLTGWANYFTLGQVSPAYEAIGRHAIRRLRQWLCRKHKVRSGKEVRFPAGDSGKSTGSPALRRIRRAFRGRRHDLVREPDAGNPHVRFDERRLETESWRGVRHRHRRKPPATATPCAYRHRASRRLYKVPAAFERRCIPPDCVARRLHMPNMRPPHALSGGRLAALGATRGSTTGCWITRTR